MSEENVELAQRAYAAFQRNDLDGFLACVPPSAEWYPLAHEIEGATHGHDGVRLWWAGLFTVFPDLNPTIAGTARGEGEPTCQDRPRGCRS